MRTCKVCNIEKELDAFPSNQKVPGGKVYRRYTCTPCWSDARRGYLKQWAEDNKEYLRAYEKKRHGPERRHAQKKHYYKLKKIVFEHYGAVCDCCGENEVRFLTIDHINNDGAEHRKEVAAGAVFFKWIIINNFPNTVRILCFNCNSGRYHNGGVCPHEERLADIVPIGWKAPEVK